MKIFKEIILFELTLIIPIFFFIKNQHLFTTFNIKKYIFLHLFIVLRISTEEAKDLNVSISQVFHATIQFLFYSIFHSLHSFSFSRWHHCKLCLQFGFQQHRSTRTGNEKANRLVKQSPQISKAKPLKPKYQTDNIHLTGRKDHLDSSSFKLPSNRLNLNLQKKYMVINTKKKTFLYFIPDETITSIWLYAFVMYFWVLTYM